MESRLYFPTRFRYSGGMETRPFNIMAKPVCSSCNLDCAYCYYTAKAKELYPDDPSPRMNDAVLESYVSHRRAEPEGRPRRGIVW